MAGDPEAMTRLSSRLRLTIAGGTRQLVMAHIAGEDAA